MDYYRSLKLQLEAVTLSSAQMGTLMVASMKPGTCVRGHVSETAPEIQHEVVAGWGENEGGPFSTLHGPSLERPRRVGCRPCSWSQSLLAGRRKHRVECGPRPRLRNSCSKSSLEAWCPVQQDWPLFQSAGAFSSPGILCGTELPSAWASPALSPGACAGRRGRGLPSSQSRTSEDRGPASVEFYVGRDLIL